ncbi:hypothetical protein K440DRAFT_636810 [Wilcoxina mikolae CBS 423.85]|nr:hypothetical protein K440DRAFT_636810 [Wilcoxina mikolae CBS 423.85]
MTFTPVKESSSTATSIKETALHGTITVERAGSRTLVDQASATTTRYRNVVSPTMVAPDTSYSAKLPPAKLSSTESSPTKPFPTVDLIPVTSKTTIDHAPVTLPLQTLESLCDGFFPNRHFDSVQEAVEIVVKELTPQDQSKFIHGVYELYYDYLRTIDSSGRIREMVKQLNTVQNNKDRATKTLGEYWQQSSKVLEILNEGDGSEKLLRLTALATRTAKDPELAKRCLNYAYVSRIIKLGRKSKVYRWYTSADFKEAKVLLEKECPVVNEEINLEKMGLKLYRGLVMPVAYYPFKEDQSRIRTLSPSALPPNRQIPYSSPVLISSAPPTEEEEKLSDFEAPTPIVDDVTEVVDDVTEVVDEDNEATSSDNESSETAVTLTPVRTKASRKRKRAVRPSIPNPTEDKPIDGYDSVVTCSDYIEGDVRYTHIMGKEERMITYYHGI